jgi:hypothetical protein
MIYEQRGSVVHLTPSTPVIKGRLFPHAARLRAFHSYQLTFKKEGVKSRLPVQSRLTGTNLYRQMP